MKMIGDELKNTLGNVSERFACCDNNTGYSPAAAAITAAPAQKPLPGYNPN